MQGNYVLGIEAALQASVLRIVSRGYDEKLPCDSVQVPK